MGYVNQHGLSRKHIFESVEHSLRRLDLDYIDLLQCHRFDPDTPIEETMQALHDVVQSGKVRYIGMSSCYAWQCTFPQHHVRMRLTLRSPCHAELRHRQRRPARSTSGRP